MYIERHIKKTIDRMLHSFPSVLLTGPRQVGKSTLLRNGYAETRYLSMDDRVVLNAVKEDPRGFFELQGTPLILDEIQRVPEAFIDLKYEIDRDRHSGMYMLSGSQKFELMKDVSESLAGRISIVNMLGLSMRELRNEAFNSPFLPDADYLSSRNGQPYMQEKLWEIIQRGSMPELYADPDMDWESFYASYVDTYVVRDVRELSQVGDTTTFVQFMTALAARTGELLNMHALALDVGVDDKTIKHWISILETSGLVYLLQPFSLNITKRAVKTPKLYFTDTGLVCYLCRWLTPETLRNGAQSGNIFETFVVSEILKSYYNAGRNPDMYFFRNSNGQEVDLLFYQNNTLYPVEIKKTASPNVKDIKHFKVLQSYFPTVNIGSGALICNYDHVIPLDAGTQIVPVGWI